MQAYPATHSNSPLFWMAACLLFGACQNDASQSKPLQLDPPTQSNDDLPVAGGPVATGTYAAGKTDDGFGTAVAISGSNAWASAPHGQQDQVYQLGDEAVSVLSSSGRLGTSLVSYADGFLAGAPLANKSDGFVLDQDGNTVAEGGGVGISLWANEDGWIAARANGWIDHRGVTGSSSGRPSSVAMLSEQVAIGAALGAYPLEIDSLTLDRIETRDEAGFALAVGDLDQDGENEWVVGAPGANAVYVINPDMTLQTTIQGTSGRFGAAVAVADVDGDGVDDLVVGAPMLGETVYGAAYLYSGGDFTSPEETWRGQEPGAQLGFSVAAANGLVLMGAPGGASTQGSVLVASP